MSAEDVVDAALAGLDQGDFVTIPALPNVADWEAFEAAREALLPNLSRATPAERYQVKAPEGRTFTQHGSLSRGATNDTAPRTVLLARSAP